MAGPNPTSSSPHGRPVDEDDEPGDGCCCQVDDAEGDDRLDIDVRCLLGHRPHHAVADAGEGRPQSGCRQGLDSRQFDVLAHKYDDDDLDEKEHCKQHLLLPLG